MKSRLRDTIWRYSIAVVSVALITWARRELSPWLGDRVPFGLFFVSVTFTAWYGGLGPALLALALGTLSAAHFFIPPHDSLAITDLADKFSLAIYGLIGISIALMSESLRMARRRAEAVAEENERLNRELREVTERKDRFLATLAHELRNPLAAARTALDVLSTTEPDTDDGSDHTVREVVERQIDHMVRLVDDLLDLSRVGQGKIRVVKQRVELASVIQRAAETSRPLIDSHQHELIISLPDKPVWLDVDPVRMAQVLANLLNNAAKYCDRPGQIWITAERSRGEVVIRVRDTGIGISAEMLPRIFDQFMQIDAAIDKSQGGLGIGLALVRSLVELHGGRVEAFSPGPGAGSEFVVHLPLRYQAVATDLQAAG